MPVAALEKPAAERTAMSGTLLLTHERGGKRVTVPAVMLVEWPDKLRLELQDPVGSLLGLLIVNGDQFWLYQSNRKENLTGPVTRIPSEVSFPFDPRELVRVFLARPNWAAFADATVQSGNEVSRAAYGGKEFLRFDPREHTPVEWRIEGPGGVVSKAEYEEFSAASGVRFPTKLRLVREPDARSVLLAWKDWQASVPTEKKLFQIPPTKDFGRPTKALR